MGALALYLIFGDTSQGDAINPLLDEMGWALFASGTGVLGNLIILWGLLPWANRRFNPELDRFLSDLRKEEAEQLAQAEGGLARTTAEIIGERLGEELRRAIARVPRMFEQLDKTATVLGKAADKFDADVAALTSTTADLVQSTSSLQSVIDGATSQHDKAADRLDAASQEVTASVNEVASKLNITSQKVAASVNDAAARLAETTLDFRESVESLPGRVASAVEGSGESLGRKFSDAIEPHVTKFRDGVADGLARTIEWQNVVTEHLNEAQRQYGRTIHELVSTTADIVKSVDGLPDTMAESIKKVSGRLGREFGHEAKQHVAELQSKLREDAKELRGRLERHESELLNTTVQRLQEVSKQLINETVRDLEGVSDKLVAVLNGFPEHVAAVNTRLGDAEGELGYVVGRIGKTSSALNSAHDKTGDMLAGLARSTEDLGQVIRQLAEVHAQAIRELAEALQAPPRKRRWWWRRRRRSRDEAPNTIPGEGTA
ncbi:MAG: hypothetical protein OXU64_02475 [Gemmatimonadota bacterium]|nr:hypothetical protein [Gemmatimonadota bacterium]